MTKNEQFNSQAHMDSDIYQASSDKISSNVINNKELFNEIDITDLRNKPENINIHQRLTTQDVITADEMDSRRKYQKEYEYLCYMAQARDWISRLTNVEIENNQVFKEMIQKGEIFIKLASVLTNRNIKIYEHDELVYRHSDNHNFFLSTLRSVKLRECYLYVTIDAYNAYNIPSVIYCLHALSNHCEKLGFDLRIEKEKKYIFTEKELSSVKKDIEQFSQFDFDKIGTEDVSFNYKEKNTFKNILSDLSRVAVENFKNNKGRFFKNCYEKYAFENECKNVKEKLNKLKEVPQPLSYFLAQRVKEKITSIHGKEHSDSLKMIFRFFLRRNAMKEVFSGNASLFSIREVLRRQPVSLKYQIESKHELIKQEMEENSRIELEIDNLLTSIELVLENKRLFSELPTDILPYENNQNFGRIFNIIRSNPMILLNILSKMDNIDDFVCRYILPLFSVPSKKSREGSLRSLLSHDSGFPRESQNTAPLVFRDGADCLVVRDEFLLLQIINTDFSKNSQCFYKNKDESEDIYHLSYRVVINMFRSSDMAGYLARDLFIKEDIKVAHTDQEYYDTLENLKRVVENLIRKLAITQFPYYLIYFFIKYNSPDDIKHFFKDVVSPLITAPDAFVDMVPRKVNRDFLNTVSSLIEHILTGDITINYFLPLIEWGRAIKKKFLDLFEEIKYKTNISLKSGMFRIQRPFIKLNYKELNDLLTLLKLIPPLAQIKRINVSQQGFKDMKTDIYDVYQRVKPFQSDILSDTDTSKTTYHRSEPSQGDTLSDLDTSKNTYHRIELQGGTLSDADTSKNKKSFSNLESVFNRLVKDTEPFHYIDNEDIKIYLNTIIHDSSSSDVDDLIDIIRVSKGNDLNSIINRKSTPEEEMKYKKLLNYRNMTKKKYLMEHADDDHSIGGDFYQSPTSTFTENDLEISTTSHYTVNDSDMKNSSVIDINDRIHHLDKLKSKLPSKEITPETIAKICERIEEAQIIICQKHNELKINNQTLQNLKKKNSFLIIQRKSYSDYYKSLLKNYFHISKGNCTKKSKYGTFKYSQQSLVKKRVLNSAFKEGNTHFYLSCEQAGLFNISAYQKDRQLEINQIRFENILRKRKQASILIGNFDFNPKGLISIVNQCYLQ